MISSPFLSMCTILSSREDLQQKKNSFVIFNFFLFSDIIFLHSPLLYSCGVWGYGEEEVFMEGGIMIYCQCLWMPIECWSWAEAKVISNSGFTESLLFLSVLFVYHTCPSSSCIQWEFIHPKAEYLLGSKFPFTRICPLSPDGGNHLSIKITRRQFN